jgi:hypothetical protein
MHSDFSELQGDVGTPMGGPQRAMMMVKPSSNRRSDFAARRRANRDRPLGFEPLEHRKLLSADFLDAANAFFAEFDESTERNQVLQRVAHRGTEDATDSNACSLSIDSTLQVSYSAQHNVGASIAISHQPAETLLAASAVDEVFEGNENWLHASDLKSAQQSSAAIDESLVSAPEGDYFRTNP